MTLEIPTATQNIFPVTGKKRPPHKRKAARGGVFSVTGKKSARHGKDFASARKIISLLVSRGGDPGNARVIGSTKVCNTLSA